MVASSDPGRELAPEYPLSVTEIVISPSAWPSSSCSSAKSVKIIPLNAAFMAERVPV